MNRLVVFALLLALLLHEGDSYGRGSRNRQRQRRPQRPTYELPSRTHQPSYDQPREPQKPTYEVPSRPQQPSYEVPITPQQPSYDLPREPQKPTYEVPSRPEQPSYEVPITPQQPSYDLPREPQKPTYEVPSRPQQPSHEVPITPQQPSYDLPREPQKPTYEVPSRPQQPSNEVPITPQQPSYEVPAIDQRPLHEGPSAPQEPSYSGSRTPEQFPTQPRIDIRRGPLSPQDPSIHDQSYSKTPSRGDIGKQNSHIVDLSQSPDFKPIQQIPGVGVPPIVRTIELPNVDFPKPHQVPSDDSNNPRFSGYSGVGDSDRRGRSSYQSDPQVETTGYTTVFNVNKLQGGTCLPDKLWKVDCNKQIEHRAITAIWDDYNNFRDLDKVKCGVLDDSSTLDLQDVKVINFNGYDQLCPPDYVLTAVFDKLTGFPSVRNGKCTRVAKGKLDNINHVTQKTDSYAAGPSAPLANWNVQCPHSSVAVGFNKEKGRITALICAHISQYNVYEDHITVKRH